MRSNALAFSARQTKQDEPCYFPLELRSRWASKNRVIHPSDDDVLSPEEQRVYEQRLGRLTRLQEIRVPCPRDYGTGLGLSVRLGAGAAATMVTAWPVIQGSLLVGGGLAGPLLAVGVLVGVACVTDACLRSVHAGLVNQQVLRQAAEVKQVLSPCTAAVPVGEIHVLPWARATSWGGAAAQRVGRVPQASLLVRAEPEHRLTLGLLAYAHAGEMDGAGMNELHQQISIALTALHRPDDPLEVSAALAHALNLDWYAQVDEALNRPPSHCTVASLTACVAFRERLYVANMGACQTTLHRKGRTELLSVAHATAPGTDGADAASRSGLSRALVLPPIPDTQPYRAQVAWKSLSDVKGGVVVAMTPACAKTLSCEALDDMVRTSRPGDEAISMLRRVRVRGVGDDLAVLVLPL